MLYLGGEMSKPVRIQSAFISETEVKKVVKHLTEAYQDEVPGDEINFAETASDKNVLFEGGLEDDLGDDDELYEAAKEEVIKAGKASTSYIQRKLRVGYARAARLVDMLEQRGVIGPGDGAKPREVINSLEKVADKMIDENGFEEPAEPKQF
jgi:DNA segregation ATPase FtsK/SpoIIIE, S-DNA-T family